MNSPFKFPRRVRIHGGECGAVARALHHEAQKVALIQNEQTLISDEKAFLRQAELEKASNSTFNERKQMSTKTSIKRIALVAVSALTFGVVSGIAPASAAASLTATHFITVGDTTDIGGDITFKANTADTTLGNVGRDGVVAPAIFVSKQEIGAATELKIKFTAIPTGATSLDKNVAYAAGDVDELKFASGNGVNSLLDWANDSSVDGSNVAIVLDTIAETIETGKWSYTVWADTDADGLTDSGEATVSGSLYIGGAPDTATVSFSVNPVLSGEDTVATVTLKDADGFLTILDAGALVNNFDAGGTEFLELTATAAFDNDAAINAADDLTLTSAGTYRFTVEADVAAAYTDIEILEDGNSLNDDVAITVIALGDLDKSSVLSSVNTDSSAYTVEQGVDGAVTVNTALSTVYIVVTASAASEYIAYTVDSLTDGADVTETLMKPTKVGVNKTATITLTNTTPADGEEVEVSIIGDNDTSVWTFTWADPLPEITVSPSSALSAVKGSTLSWAIAVSDQFGGAVSGVLTATVAGRNQKASTLTLTGGTTTYSLTDSDAAIVAGTNDTDSVAFKFVDADANEATASVAITWTATAPAVATVDVTASDSTPDIDTQEVLGVVDTDSVSSITATLTNASGVRLGAGIVVTFSEADTYFGLVNTFSRMTLGSGTAITNSLGEATIKSYSRKATGRQITATVAGKSGLSPKVTWSTDGDNARYVALSADLDKTVAGGFIRYTATVTDRWGNPVAGEDVTLSESGVGRFAAGSDTNPDTNVLGQVSIDLTSAATETGNGVVTATLTTANQTTDLAGFVGGVATAGVTAGVRSAAKTIEFTKDTSTSTSDALLELAKAIGTGKEVEVAADAAAEAIDAANAATDAANLAAEAADAATVAAEEARDAADAATAAVEELSTQVATLMAALKAQLTTLANTVAKIAKKVKA
jgi:hypothetical protein